jgi:hypothetical protein
MLSCWFYTILLGNIFKENNKNPNINLLTFILKQATPLIPLLMKLNTEEVSPVTAESVSG